MPFTPSHAIVALPFARTPIPAGAVAVGAMSPDLPLFFPWLPAYGVTHGFPTLLFVTLPLALVLYAVWRLALRPAASGLLPTEALRARMPWAWDRVRRPERPVVGAVLVVVGALIGVATHVFWDLFTHPDRLGSAWIPALGELWGPTEGTAWLQYASSILGLVGVAVWAVVAARRARPVYRSDPRPVARTRAIGWSLAALSLVGWSVWIVARDGVPHDYSTLRNTAFDAGTGAGATILVIALVAAIEVRAARARARD